jgi:hypothetical protein
MNEGMIPIMTSVEIAADASVATNNNATVGTWSKPGSTTGIYRWVSADKIKGPAAMVFPLIEFRAPVAVDLKAQIHAKSIDSTTGLLTVDVILNAVATPTDPSAVCGIEMVVWCKTSGVNP